ncbi:MAG: 50S ribosomal protein L9 [Candidatus Marinamargulisbacteria bacterium]
MEVILIKDLKRKGTFGDIIEVTDGYARNYLIPNGFAMIANKANKKRFNEIKEKAMLNVGKLRDELKATAEQIKGKAFTMTALSRDGKLYGSITPSVIIGQIKKELPDLKINASDVIVEDGNIKYVGTYACKAQFTKDISAKFDMVIESDESHEQPELLEAIIETDTPTNAPTDDVADDTVNHDSNEIAIEETILSEDIPSADEAHNTNDTAISVDTP